MAKTGLFVGLITLDFIYLAEHLPQANQKMVALDSIVAAGGPATNAAVAFQSLGNSSILLGVVGSNPIKSLILADLETCGITCQDLDPSRREPPPVSSIIVTQKTGDRSVISINATKTQISDYPHASELLQNVNIVLVDGHQIAVGCQIAQLAKTQNIPVVLDGGSWKPGLETLLPWIDYAICSANFHPPDTHNVTEYLAQIGIPHIAITQGQHPIQYLSANETGEIPVPQIQPIDTLGAGDIFHGAFCYAILQKSFPKSLNFAAQIATYSCEFFGTRSWIQGEFQKFFDG